MNIVSKKSTLFGFVLVGLVIGSTPMTAKVPEWNDVKNLTGKQWAIAFVLGSMFAANCKEAVAKPAEVTGDDVKNIAQLQDIFTEEYWNNVWHVINNGFLGQVGARGKAILGMTNEDDGSMTFREIKALPSTGICGKSIAILKLWGKKAKDISTVLVVPGVIASMWTTGEKASNGDFKAEAAKPDAAK